MAHRIPFWLRALFFAALGLLLATVLPEWAWISFTILAVVAFWGWMWRRNRRREEVGRHAPAAGPPS